MKCFNILFFAATISFFSTTAIISADDFESMLNDITEIATKNKLNIDHTPGIISVITGEEMMKMGISHFDIDALNMIPGMSSIASRKSNDWTKLLFQINGISINTHVTGVGLLPMISTKSIRRIEIIRGASSAIHGASAYTALINIVTKQDENSVWIDYTNYSSSNHDVALGALLNHKVGDVDVSLRLHTLNAEGMDQMVTQDAASLGGILPTNTPSKVNKGIENYDIGLNIKYENWTVDYERLSSSSKAGYGVGGGYLPMYNDNNTFSETKNIIEVRNDSKIGDYKINTKLGYMDFTQKTDDMYVLPANGGLPDYILSGETKENNIYVDIEVSRKLGNHDILVGGRYFRSKLEKGEYLATIDFSPVTIYATPSDVGNNMPKVKRNVKSIYLQDYYNITDITTLVSNIRLDDVSDIDETIVSPRFALIHEINDKNIIKAQYAKAFLIPLYYPLYSRTPFIPGNPDLEIDKAHTYELSHIYKEFTKSLKSTLYYVDMYSVDTIVFDTSHYIIKNNSKQSAGLEVEYSQKLDSFDLKTNFTYNFYSKQKYIGTQDYNDDIMRLPKYLANIVINKNLTSNLSTTIWYNYIGEKQQYLSTLKTNEKHLINLNLTYLAKVNDNSLSITLSANDVLNQQYAEVPAVNTFKTDEFLNNTRRYMLQVSYIF